MPTISHASRAPGFVAATLLLSAVGAAAQAPTPNLFVSCPGNNSIVEISPNGTASTFTSGLDAPADLAFDNAGNLFEADEGSGDVYEFVNNNGTLSTTPVLYASGLDKPYGLAIGLLGLYVSEYGNGDIAEVAANGTVTTFATGLGGPEGLAYATPGDLYVAEQQEGFVAEISSTGTKAIIAAGLNGPSGLTGASAEGVYVSNQGGDNVDEIVSKTAESYVSDLDDPNGIALSGTELYEADTGSGDINVFTREIGGLPHETTLATGLDEPVGLALQPVPEPAVWAVMVVGAGVLLVGCRRNRVTEPRGKS
jgi:hypothetical protein